MRKGFSKILKIIFIFFASLLIISSLSIYINPNKIWILAFFGFVYPYILIVNILFLIYWIIRRKKDFFISLLVLIITLPYSTDIFQINFKSSFDDNENTIKFMSFNVRVFDLYNWNTNYKTRDSIIDYIKNENPDVLCIQEFFYDQSNKFPTRQILCNDLGYKYFHDEYTMNVVKVHNFGIATFSKYPIVNTGALKFRKTNNICIYTDILINGDTIRFYNGHLQSVHFGKFEYETIDSLGLKIDQEQITGIKGIMKKLKNAYEKRANQTDLILKNIENSPHRIVACGDFNDTPVSYTYNKFSKKLDDAFIESGNGFGSSYIGRIPFLRIDFIFHSKEIKSTNFQTHKIKLSDHYPISCELSFSKD